MSTSVQEALWVLRAQCDDREALELLLDSIQAPLLRYLRGLVGRDAADDDVLVLIFRNLVWLEDPALFRPWVFRIASRAAFRWLNGKTSGSKIRWRRQCSKKSPCPKRGQRANSCRNCTK